MRLAGRSHPYGASTHTALHQEVQLEQTAPEVPLALGQDARDLMLPGPGVLRQTHQPQVAADAHLGESEAQDTTDHLLVSLTGPTRSWIIRV